MANPSEGDWVVTPPKPPSDSDWVVAGPPTALTMPQTLRAGGQGALLGWSDEAMAVARSLMGSETYDQALKDERAKMAEARKNNPGLVHSLEFAGGFAVPGLGLLSKAIKPAATTLGQVAQGFGLGGLIGGTAAAGAADENKLAAIPAGVAIGSGIGAALPFGGAALGGIVQKGRELLAPAAARARHGIDAAADEVLLNRMRNAGITPGEVQADLQAGRAAAQLPRSTAELPEAIMDVNPSLQRQASSVFRAGGEGGNAVQSMVAERQGGDPLRGLFGKVGVKGTPPANQFERLGNDIRRGWGIFSKDLDKELATIKGEQRVLGNADYKRAWANEQPFDDALQQTLVAWNLKAKTEPGKAENAALTEALSLFPRKGPTTPQTDALALANEKIRDRLDAAIQKRADLARGIAEAEQKAANAKTTAAADRWNQVAARLTAGSEKAAKEVGYLSQQGQITLDRLAEVHAKLGQQAFPITTLQRFDAVKRSIDGQISSATNDNVKRLLTQFKNDLLNAVHGGDRMNPTINKDYAAARAAWGSREELKEAAKMGGHFMRGTGDATIADYKELPAAAQKMWRLGAWRELQTMMGGTGLGPTADFTKLFYKPNVYMKLRQMTPQGQTSTQLNQLVNRERRMSQTSAEVLGNSTSVQRLQDDAEFAGRDMLGTAISSFRSSGGILNLGIDVLQFGIQKMFGYRDDMARALAQRLTEMSPAQQDLILQRLGQRMGRSALDKFLAFAQHMSLPTSMATAGHVARGNAENFKSY